MKNQKQTNRALLHQKFLFASNTAFSNILVTFKSVDIK